MFSEGILSHFCDGVGGVGLFADKPFYGCHITCLFKGAEVAGKVPVGQFQGLFEGAEFYLFIYHEHGHNSEADPVFKGLIEFVKMTFHFSYLKYIQPPYTMCSTPNPTAQNSRPNPIQ